MENVKNHLISIIDELRSAVIADDVENYQKIFQRLGFVAQSYFSYCSIVEYLENEKKEVKDESNKTN